MGNIPVAFLRRGLEGVNECVNRALSEMFERKRVSNVPVNTEFTPS